MLDQKFFNHLKKEFKETAEDQREIKKAADEALHLAKRAIFSFHRNDWKSGEDILSDSLNNLKQAIKIGGDLDFAEGSFRAALEEYAEADLFRQFLYKEKISDIRGVDVNFETYLGGLADLIGEILRYAVKSATARQFPEVKRCQETVDEIMGQLIEFNLTGYLRTKYDQAKQARRKLEQVVYDVSLRQK